MQSSAEQDAWRLRAAPTRPALQLTGCLERPQFRGDSKFAMRAKGLPVLLTGAPLNNKSSAAHFDERPSVSPVVLVSLRQGTRGERNPETRRDSGRRCCRL